MPHDEQLDGWLASRLMYSQRKQVNKPEDTTQTTAYTAAAAAAAAAAYLV